MANWTNTACNTTVHGSALTGFDPTCLAGSCRAQFFIRLGLDPGSIKQSIDDRATPSGGPMPEGEIPSTRRTKRILEMAANEAKEMESQSVRTRHLLLALLKDERGAAAQVLAEAYDLDYKTARQAIE